MATTGDGGRTWRTAPLVDASPLTLYDVTPLGPGAAALRAADPGEMRLLVTADGGVTWRRARVLPAVDAVPANWFPLGRFDSDRAGGLYAVDPCGLPWRRSGARRIWARKLRSCEARATPGSCGARRPMVTQP